MPKKVLPGLKNFYMAGQWVEPGGSVPMVAMSGRSAIQLVCHADGRKFSRRIRYRLMTQEYNCTYRIQLHSYKLEVNIWHDQ